MSWTRCKCRLKAEAPQAQSWSGDHFGPFYSHLGTLCSSIRPWILLHTKVFQSQIWHLTAKPRGQWPQVLQQISNRMAEKQENQGAAMPQSKSRPGYKYYSLFYIRLIHILSFALLCSFHADAVSGRSLTLKSAFSIKRFFFFNSARSVQTDFHQRANYSTYYVKSNKTPASLKTWFDPIMWTLASNLWLCALPVFHFVRYRLFPPLPPISLCDLYVSKMIYTIFRNNVPSNH